MIEQIPKIKKESSCTSEFIKGLNKAGIKLHASKMYGSTWEGERTKYRFLDKEGYCIFIAKEWYDKLKNHKLSYLLR